MATPLHLREHNIFIMSPTLSKPIIPYLILGELIMMTLELVVVSLNPIFYISTSHSMSKISLLLHYLLIENLGPHMSEC